MLKASCSAALLFCGCLREPDPPLRIATSLWPGHAPLFLARSQGLLRGKPLKLVEYPSTPEILRGFQNGAVELAALTGEQFLRLSEQLPEIRAILVMDYSAGADVLLAQPKLSIGDLPGRKAGVEPNSSGAYFFCRALEIAGVDPASIELAPIRSHLHPDAFEKAGVDALVTSEPYCTRLIQHGAEVLFDSRQIKTEMPDLLVVREETLEKRRALVKELVSIWFAARATLLQNPAEASTLLARRYGVSPAEFEAILSLLEFPSGGENHEMLASANPGLLTMLETIRGHMVRHSLLTPGAPVHVSVEGGLLA